MPTATRSKPGSSRRRSALKSKPAAARSDRKASTRKAANSDGAAKPPRSAAEIEAYLGAQREKLRGLEWHDTAKIEPIHASIADLEDELERAHLATLPPPADRDKLPDPRALDNVKIATIEISGNHRERMSGPEADRLARSLGSFGLLEPIAVREIVKGERYELIWGARRLAAAGAIGWEDIGATVYPASTTPEQVEILRSVENLHCEDLSPVGRALAVARMIAAVNERIDGTGDTSGDWDLAQTVQAAGGVEAYIAQYIGRPVEWVRDHAYVAKVGGKIRDLLSTRRLDLGHVRECAKLADQAAAERLALAAARDPGGSGGKPVAWIRERVAGELRSLARVPWALDAAFGEDKDLGCKGWACYGCPHNTASDPGLFGMVAESGDGADLVAGSCSNPPCFGAKQAAADKLISIGVGKVRREIKKNGDLDLNIVSLERFIPPEIRPAAFIRAVKAAEVPAASNGSAKSPKATPIAEASEETKAARAHEDRLAKWGKAAAREILAKIAGDPLRVLYYLTMRSASKFEAVRYRTGDEKHNAKAAKVASRGDLPATFKRMKAPGVGDLKSLAKQLGKPTDPVYVMEVAGLVPEAISAIAAALGAKIEDPPAAAEVQS